MRRARLVLLVAVVLALGGCGAGQLPEAAPDLPVPTVAQPSTTLGSVPDAAPRTTAPTEGAAATPSNEESVGTALEGSDTVGTVEDPADAQVPEEYLAAVVADAAERAGVATSDVDVVEAYGVDWPDASLGCPEPGMMYAQVITSGYRVVVDAGGTRFDYRLTAAGAFRLCDGGGGLTVPDPPDKSGTVPLPPPPSDS